MKKIIVSLIIAIALLSAVELINRLALGKIIPKTRFNSIGMRGSKELSEYADTAQKKIVFIGNSVTLGHGIPDRELYTEIVGNNLKQFLTINCGYDGANLWHLYNVYKKEIKNIKPDYLVYTPISPDFSINYDMDSEDAPFQYNESKKPHTNEVFTISQTMKFLHLKIREYNTKIPGLGITWEDHWYTETALSPIDQKYKWKIKAILSAINEEVKRGKGQMVIVIVPSRELYYQYNPETELKRYDDLKEIADEVGIKYINLIPRFKEKKIDENTALFLDKVHFNSYGHAVLAGLLTDVLKNDVIREE